MSLQLHSTSQLDIYSACSASQLEIPVVTAGIAAGFPSPAMDFIDLTIDMNRHLVKHPSATFYGRVQGHSMKDVGIFDGDLLVSDKSLEPKNDKIAVCYLDGEFTVKRIKVEKGSVWLIPANTDFQPIQVTEDNDFLIWGIVTHVIKAF
jgi:DNA polymerase V